MTRSESRKNPRRPRVGDIVAIPLGSDRFAFARVLRGAGIEVYRPLSDRPILQFTPEKSHVAMSLYCEDGAMRSGEWPLVGKLTSSDPEDDWPPPQHLPDILAPNRPRIYWKGQIIPSTPAGVEGMELFGLKSVDRTVAVIRGRLLDVDSTAPMPTISARPRKDWELFCNDDAADLLAGLERARGWSSIQRALQRVAGRLKWLEAPPCKAAVAAAEVVATGGGHPSADIPDAVRAFLARVGPLPAELVPLARKAAEKVQTDSELRDLWHESSHFAEWDATLTDLRQRLGNIEP